MGRLQADLVAAATSDAQFRAWAQFIHDAFIAAGWVQTTDTGQVTISTMVVPGAAGFAGYEVWTLNDSLRATKPILCKVEYGRGTANTIPRVQFTVGPTSDGAGTLGSSWGAAILPGNTLGSTVPESCYGSGDGHGIMLTMWSSVVLSGHAFQFLIDRSRDINGDATGDGLAYGAEGDLRVLAYSGVWATTNCATVRQVSPIPVPNTTSATFTTGLSPDGDTFYWHPMVLACPGVPAWRTPLMVGVLPYDRGLGSTFDIAVNGGAAKTFIQTALDMGGVGMGTFHNSATNRYFMSQQWAA